MFDDKFVYMLIVCVLRLFFVLFFNLSMNCTRLRLIRERAL